MLSALRTVVAVSAACTATASGPRLGQVLAEQEVLIPGLPAQRSCSADETAACFWETDAVVEFVADVSLLQRGINCQPASVPVHAEAARRHPSSRPEGELSTLQIPQLSNDSSLVSVLIWIAVALICVGLIVIFILCMESEETGQAAEYLESVEARPKGPRTRATRPRERTLLAPRDDPPAPAAQPAPAAAPAPEPAAGPAPGPADGPPALCPMLVLPKTESVFLVPMESVREAQGSFQITGPSLRPLFLASVAAEADGGRRLAISLAHGSAGAMCTITASGRVLEVRGQGGSHYGLLQDSTFIGDCSNCTLTANDRVLLQLSVQDATARAMLATTPGNRVLASASPLTTEMASTLGLDQDRDPSSFWRVLVMPQSDALLMLACMLGLSLFRLG